MPAKQFDILAYMKAQFAAAPGKCITLLGLFGIFLIVVSVQFFRGGPHKVNASQETLLPSGMSTQALGGPTINTEKPTHIVDSSDKWSPHKRPESLQQELARDLFNLAITPNPLRAPPMKDNPELGSADNFDEESPQWVLEGTLLRQGTTGEHAAVVSGRIVHTGDRLGRFVVRAIDPRQVTLEAEEEILLLRMD